MKKLNNVLMILCMVLAVMLISPAPGHSQPPPPPSKPTQTPIDGGLGLLAAAGGAYAIKKLRARKSKG
jgi:hypothetical protein